MSEKTSCKKYVANIQGAKQSILLGLGSFGLILLYLNIISDWQLPKIWYFMLLSVIIPIFFLSSNATRFHTIEIDDHSIRFVPLYNKKDPLIYEWENIKICMLGKFGFSYGNIPYIGKGIQIHYLSGTGINRSITLYQYPLGHIANYDDLLKDVQNRCEKYSISFEEIE